MTDAIRVFISSTFNELRAEREFAGMVCQRMALEHKAFPEQSVPGSGRDYIEELLKSHILVLLVQTKQSKHVDEEIRVARANGIPIIPFHKVGRRSSRARPQASRWAERLKKHHGFEFIHEFDSLAELEDGLRRGLSRVLFKRFSSPLRFQPWSADVYEQARDFIFFAGTRLAISQETSTLVLGPHVERRMQERKFYDALVELMEDVLGGSSQVRFLHVFGLNPTLQAFSNDAASYPRRNDAVKKLRSLERRISASDRIGIYAVDAPVNAAIVGDAAFQMATVYGDRYYAWVHEFGAGANRLWEILETLGASKGLSLKQFLASLP